MTEEAKLTKISVIHDDTINLGKGYYHGVYVLLHFKKEDFMDRMENQADMEAYKDKA